MQKTMPKLSNFIWNNYRVQISIFCQKLFESNLKFGDGSLNFSKLIHNSVLCIFLLYEKIHEAEIQWMHVHIVQLSICGRG